MEQRTVGIRDEMWDKISKEKEKYGFATNSQLIRSAIHEFFREGERFSDYRTLVDDEYEVTLKRKKKY